MYKFSNFIFDLSRLALSPFLLALRVKVYNKGKKKENLKVKGGVIIVSNHTRFRDPFVVYSTFWRRRVRYLVGEVVVKKKVFGYLLKKAGCIPINRNITDIEAIKKSIGVLKAGYALAVFPQGGISHEEKIKEIKSGVIFMALQANVPIQPMYHLPRKHWFQRQKVILGERIFPSQLITKKIPSIEDMNNIAQLLIDSYARMHDDLMERMKK